MAVRLPCFTKEGLLPPGDYPLTMAELQDSQLVTGPRLDVSRAAWDTDWRRQLVANLHTVVSQLWRVGIGEVFVNGSFVEDKSHPNDIDGYFECDALRFASGQLEEELNRLDPTRCWTWDSRSRRAYRGSPKRQLPMWHVYRVELYPHHPGLVAGHDVHGNALEFPAWFRQRRSDGLPKGIVKLIRPSVGSRP